MFNRRQLYLFSLSKFWSDFYLFKVPPFDTCSHAAKMGIWFYLKVHNFSTQTWENIFFTFWGAGLKTQFTGTTLNLLLRTWLSKSVETHASCCNTRNKCTRVKRNAESVSATHFHINERKDCGSCAKINKPFTHMRWQGSCWFMRKTSHWPPTSARFLTPTHDPLISL